MLLSKLYLRNFRSYTESDFSFAPGINLIYGGNGQGKTTVLEAIYCLMTGRSFRTSQSDDMIQQGQEQFYLEALFIKNQVEQKLRITQSESDRKIIYNSTVCPSLNSLFGILSGVLINPNDQLISGSPALRRNFLDMHISQADPLYLHHLTRYHRALKQRNALLRKPSQAAIESWEQELAAAAVYITQQRRVAIEELAKSSRDIYYLLSGTTHFLTLHYQTKAPAQDLKEFFLKQYQQNRPRESILGSTMSGPHRDELLVSLQGQEARYFASEGERRACMSALRLASWHRLKEQIQDAPLLLFDDAGLSLDHSRKAKTIEYLATLGQVFLTSTEKFSLPASAPESQFFYISQGEQLPEPQ